MIKILLCLFRVYQINMESKNQHRTKRKASINALQKTSMILQDEMQESKKLK